MDHRNRKDAGDEDEWSFTDKSVETCVMFCDGLNNKYYRSMLKAAMKAVYLTDDVVEKLKNLYIEEPGNVPLVHKFQESMAQKYSEDTRNLLQKMGVDFITKYTPEEDEIIRTNWEKFSEEYGFKVPLPFILPKYRHMHYPKTIEKIKFVRYLGRGLPKRSLRSIYRRFCHLYRCCQKGSFTKAEDKLILFHCKKGKDSEPMSTLSRILGRHKSSIRFRLHKLESRLLSGTIKWNKRVIHDVVKSLLEVTGYENITDLYNQDISKQTWKEVGKKCILNPVAIEKFWKRKLSTQLFSAKHILLNATRIQLISKLHKENVKTWREIDWSIIAEDFEGVSPYFLKSVFKKVLKTCYPNKNWEAMKSNFPGVIADLHHRYIPILMNEPYDYLLQRYQFQHEKVIVKRLRG